MSYSLEVPVGLKATSLATLETKKRTSSKLSTGGLTRKQQAKQDALDLAELIYDIFKANESSASIQSVSGKDTKNA